MRWTLLHISQFTLLGIESWQKKWYCQLLYIKQQDQWYILISKFACIFIKMNSARRAVINWNYKYRIPASHIFCTWRQPAPPKMPETAQYIHWIEYHIWLPTITHRYTVVWCLIRARIPSCVWNLVASRANGQDLYLLKAFSRDGLLHVEYIAWHWKL